MNENRVGPDKGVKATEVQEDQKKTAQYRSYEEFRNKFYKSKDNADPEQHEASDGSASFGKRLAREFVNRK